MALPYFRSSPGAGASLSQNKPFFGGGGTIITEKPVLTSYELRKGRTCCGA